MQYSQKYTLVSFLAPIEIDAEFMMSDWPPHISLADVFAIELDAPVKRQLARLMASQPTISLTAAKQSVLGATDVVLIEKNSQLQMLHNKIVDLLESCSARFNTPEFTRSGFIPHSTIQKSGRLYEGDEIKIETVSLVDMLANKNWQQRKVLVNFKLHEPEVA